MQAEKPVIISLEEWLSKTRRNNLHITVGILSFMSMMFHFTTVYFFTLQLESLAMVGIFLWLGNLFAFLFDIPVGILQYHFRAKTLYMFGIVAQIIAMAIFANFIFSITSSIWGELVNQIGVAKNILSLFLLDGINIILLVIAAMCYGFAKEANDITTISYILNNAHPNQYKSIIAKNNIFFGVGSFFWLFLSWFILTFAPTFIIVSLILMICITGWVMYFFFDNSNQVIHIEDIKNIYLTLSDMSLEKTKRHVTQMIERVDIKQVLWSTKYIILKPVRVSHEKSISLSEIVDQTKMSFKDIYETLAFSIEKHLVVYWSCIMLLTFGFWDTFASTFLIDFLNQVRPGLSFVLLGLIAIPAFWLQSMFWKLADKVGAYKISLIGLMLSWGSLAMMAFFTSNPSTHFWIIMILALINSVGYSICMSLSVASFLEAYNISYADRKWLKQIDANASAAPMKILQNFANVVGLFLWGMILSFAGFAGFFFVFWVFIFGFFVWSIVMKKQIMQ